MICRKTMRECQIPSMCAPFDGCLAAYEMSPAEIEAQRQSWVRAFTTPCEHGELDFEQCPQCRGAQQEQP